MRKIDLGYIEEKCYEILFSLWELVSRVGRTK